MRFMVFRQSCLAFVVLPGLLASCGGDDTARPETASTGGMSSTGAAQDPAGSGGVPTGGEASMSTSTSSATSTGGETSTGGGTTGAGETTMGTTTLAPKPSWCGDGEVDPGEQCDEGEANANEGACTEGCLLARCGDGYVQSDRGEVCDKGDGENVPESDPEKVPYGGCGACVQEGHWCGDGTIEGEEECDPGAPPTDAKCEEMTCRFLARMIFITSSKHSGDLEGLGLGLGIDGADSHCNVLAAGAGLSGTFRAWLLASGSTIGSRFGLYVGDAKTRFVRRDGTLLAQGFAALLAGPMLGVTLDEQEGEQEGGRVWTNIRASGESTIYDCGQWTQLESGMTNLFGFTGLASQDGALWTQKDPEIEKSKFLCKNSAHFYCVQVSD